MINQRPIRSRLTRIFPRGNAIRLGPVSLRRQADGLLLGPTKAHPTYGSRYRVEPLPAGMSPDELREYVTRMGGWYHSIDLGNGVITPGGKPLEVIEKEWASFNLGDLTGKSVLDIGGIDGAYAFLAEKAGAARVAVLDHYLWASDASIYSPLYDEHRAAGIVPPAPHETDAWKPDTLPTRWRFDVARQALNSKVEGIPLDFLDCDLAQVGRWDVVFYLGVLYHMTDPVGALKRLAAVTRREAIIETEAMFIRDHPENLWRYFADGELNFDATTFFAPNIGALMGALGTAGFSNAEAIVGEPIDDPRPGDGPHHYRAIVRAYK